MIQRTLVVILSLILSVPVFLISEAGADDPGMKIEIRYSVQEKVLDGYTYERILIDGGGIERADGGFEVPFLSIPLMVHGRISSIDVAFSQPFTLGYEAPPWSAPTHEGTVTDPEHIPGSDLVREERFALNDLGDGPEGSRFYSLKLYPVDNREGYSTRVFREAEVLIETAPIMRQFSVPSERKPVGDIKYLIITDSDLVDAVSPLAEWKCQKGLFAKIATMDEIDSLYAGNDKAKKMRQYVMEMEARYDIDYLLLAGDYDLVPTRAAHIDYSYPAYGEPSYYATDGYFACVDSGTTWNKDGDSQWAEPGEIDDPVPDMAVGRLAIDSPDVMEDVVQSLLARELALEHSEECDVPVYMAGDPVSNPGYPPNTLDHFWDTYGSDIFPDRETLYYDGTGTMSFGSTSFKNVVDDRHQFLGYFSHGDSTYIPSLYDRNDVQYLSGNGLAGAFFAMACLTAWFDRPSGFTGDCLAEALTETPDKGFVGYIGASRLAVGDIDTAYSGDAPGLMEDYWRGVKEAVDGNINSTVGDIYRYAVTHFSGAFYPFPGGMNDASLRTFLEYNLLGEPDAPLIIEDPETLSLDFTLAPDHSSVTATVMSGGFPAEGVTVTISRLGELGRSAVTGPSGTVTMTIPPSNGGNITITAYMRGDISDHGHFILPDELSPVSSVAFDPPVPNGLNGYYTVDPAVTISGDEDVTAEYRLNLGPVQTTIGGVPFALQNGDWDIAYRVVDAAGHTSDWNNTSAKVDRILPMFTIVTDPEVPDGKGGWFISPVNVSIRTEETVLDAEARLDDSPWFPLSEFYPIEAGTHTIGVRVKDPAGNMNQSSFSMKVDSSAPRSTISISSAPDGENGYYRISPSILLKTNDANSPMLYYSWDDDSTWIEYSSPFTAPEGIHTLLYRATDMPGNVETTHYVEFKVDTVGPALTIATDPPSPDGTGPWYKVNPRVNVSWTEGSMRYALVPEGITPLWSIYGTDWKGPVTIPEGNWTISFLCIDPAGNEVRTGLYTYHVDTTPPTLSFDIWPPDPDGENGWYLTPPTINAFTDPGSRIYYRLNGSAQYQLYRDLICLEDNDYIVELKAVDPAGNEAYNVTQRVLMDKDAPWIYISSLKEGEMVRSRSFNLNWSGGDNIPGSEGYMLRLDSGDFFSIGNSTYHILDDLSDGSHHFTIIVRDRAGNKAESGMGFRVDATIPRSISHSPTGNAVPVSSSISVNFSEGMDRERVIIVVEGVHGTARWDENRCILVPDSPMMYGRTYSVIVEGYDLNGNAMEPLHWNFTTERAIEPHIQDDYGLDPVIPIAGAALLLIAVSTALFVVMYLRRRRDDDLEFFE